MARNAPVPTLPDPRPALTLDSPPGSRLPCILIRGQALGPALPAGAREAVLRADGLCSNQKVSETNPHESDLRKDQSFIF